MGTNRPAQPSQAQGSAAWPCREGNDNAHKLTVAPTIIFRVRFDSWQRARITLRWARSATEPMHTCARLHEVAKGRAVIANGTQPQTVRSYSPHHQCGAA